MKALGCMVLWLVGVLFMSFDCFSGEVSGITVDESSTITSTITNTENLKGHEYDFHFDDYDERSSDREVRLEDYRPTNPRPSSKASVKHGTIYHGTPLMPYIPKPNPSPPSPSPPQV